MFLRLLFIKGHATALYVEYTYRRRGVLTMATKVDMRIGWGQGGQYKTSSICINIETFVTGHRCNTEPKIYSTNDERQ